jgi:ComF family protein
VGERRADLLPGRRIADLLLAALLAPRCVACEALLDSPTRGPVCQPCWRSIHLTAPRFLPSPLIACGRAAGEYEGALRNILHAFKYEGRRSLAHPLAVMIRDAADDVLVDADCVVPVPLHPFRRLRRGFNQATDLARGLGRPVVCALARVRSTRQQMGLTADARRQNIRGAMRRSPWLSRQTAASHIEDRVVVIVDDVRTTGATLEACAAVLKEMGAREVRAVTAAFARRT